MAKTGFTQVEIGQTFQVWLDKTNEIVDIISSDALTASALGDTTNGNATLVGRFTADNMTVVEDLIVDSITPSLGSPSTKVNGRLDVDSSVQGALRVISAAGPRIQYTSGTVVWETGFALTAGNNFIINTGSGQSAKLNLTSTGNLSTYGSITAGLGGFVGNLDGDVFGNADTASKWQNAITIDFNGTGSHITADTSFELDGSKDVSVALVIADDAIELGTKTTGDYVQSLTAGTGVTLDNNSGEGAAPTINIGQSVGTGDDVQFKTVKATTSVSSPLFKSISGAGSIEIGNGVELRHSNNGTVRLSTESNGISVQGNLSVSNNISGGNLSVFNITASGTINASNDITAFYNLSDIRLKENINLIEGALDKLDKISGYTFNYKNRQELKIAGVIAQELKEVLPEAVYVIDEELDGEKTDVLAVRYDSIIPLLIEAIKELKSEVNDLKNK